MYGRLAPDAMVTSRQIGRAMLAVARGAEAPAVVDVPAMVALAGRG